MHEEDNINTSMLSIPPRLQSGSSTASYLDHIDAEELASESLNFSRAHSSSSLRSLSRAHGPSPAMNSPTDVEGLSTASIGSAGLHSNASSLSSHVHRDGSPDHDKEHELHVKPKQWLAYEDTAETTKLVKQWARNKEHNHMNKYVFAVRHYTRCLAELPQSCDHHLSRSWAYFMRGQHELSLQDAQIALELQPSNLTAFLRVICALESLGEVEEAEQKCMDGLLLEPTDIRLKKALVELQPLVLKERGQRAMMSRSFEDAAKIYGEASAMRSSMRPFFLVAQSKALSMAGHAKDAVEVVRVCVHEHPRCVRISAHFAFVCSMQLSLFEIRYETPFMTVRVKDAIQVVHGCVRQHSLFVCTWVRAYIFVCECGARICRGV